MSRFTFAALASALLSASAAAQKVPARDLLEFPLGLLADAPALDTRMTASLWNPASRSAGPTARGEVGLAGLTTPQAQGVQLDMVGAEYRVRPRLSASLSLAQASVTDVLHTETDPQSIGSEIPYGTSVISAGLALTDQKSMFGTWSAGAALRFRSATVDQDKHGAPAIDGGLIVDRILGTPLRGAVSTFLFTPDRSQDVGTYMAAIDAPVFRRDSSLVVRIGYSLSETPSHGRDDYAFTTIDHRWFDVGGGVDWSTAFGNRDHRVRLGLGFHYASYVVAVGREEGTAGLGANYQFLLTRTIP